LAQAEARRLKHNYTGPEHLLLGLLHTEGGLAAEVLESLGVRLDDARWQVERMVGTGDMDSPEALPFTPRAKKIIELALREALRLDHNYIGSEHLLLAVVDEPDSVACRILLAFNADPPKVRDKLIRRLPQAGSDSYVPATGRRPDAALDSDWVDGLAGVLVALDAEIRSQLKRAPDVGDLLIACACVPHTNAYHALCNLGIDIDQLSREIEQSRVRQDADQRTRTTQLREVAEAEALAIEEHRLNDAALLRDQKRELRDQPEAHRRAQLESISELRRRLGLIAASES
jgi:ATP-dependent Clp protease ATP-binding subunit ClpA